MGRRLGTPAAHAAVRRLSGYGGLGPSRPLAERHAAAQQRAQAIGRRQGQAPP